MSVLVAQEFVALYSRAGDNVTTSAQGQTRPTRARLKGLLRASANPHDS